MIRQAISGASSHCFSAQLPAQSSTEANWCSLEEPRQALAVLGVAGDDARPDQPDVVGLADADDLARIFRGEIGHRVVARHAGHAGNQQRQRDFRERIDATDHRGQGVKEKGGTLYSSRFLPTLARSASEGGGAFPRLRFGLVWIVTFSPASSVHDRGEELPQEEKTAHLQVDCPSFAAGDTAMPVRSERW